MLSLQSCKSLPTDPGVYLFLDASNQVLYVGKAKHIKNRVTSYFTNRSHLGEKTRLLLAQATTIKTYVVESELESLLLEANYIKKYNPRYNIRLTDGKAYILIEITLGDIYPKVLLARREGHSKSVYFGPFPSSQTVKTVLKTIRRIFPYQAVPNHPKRVCLYHHLGLCPCPPVFDSQELQKTYKKTIQHIVDFLSGNKRKVIKELEKERNSEAKDQNFERAQALQKKIDAIHYITSRVHKPFEYEQNPNLRSDIREKELTSLQKHLGNHGVQTAYLHRIECYDNSNIQGHNAVSSMVVLTDGEIDKSQYRKFKVRTVAEGKPNDFATMQEVLQRRLKHDEWQLPDLIIVDGGKGQVSVAKEVLETLSVNIPLIGLAKREETIVTADLKEISLLKDSEALHLIMRIRDEAHRFAITYHRNLRKKAFLANT